MEAQGRGGLSPYYDKRGGAETRTQTLAGSALGLVSTTSFPAIVGTADMMLKASGVHLIAFEKIGGGHCTAVVRGNIADVRLAVDVGAETAQNFGQFVSKAVISRPMGDLEDVLPISERMVDELERGGRNQLSNQAIGLLETRGFPAMVGAADAMLKAAEVQLAAYEIIGDGLCTAIIRGNVSDVAVAMEAGMAEAERIGELHAVMVIPRALEELDRVLPVASCWLETPLQLPLELKEKEKETVTPERSQNTELETLALPDLSQLPIPEKQPEQVDAEP